MASALYSVEDAILALGAEETDGPVLESIIDGLVRLLETKAGISYSGDASAVTDEPHNGDGRMSLYTNRPIATLTTVKIGTDPTTPWVTLEGTNADEVRVDPEDPQRIVRPTGLYFPIGYRNVFVTYVPQSSLEPDARAAVRSATAFIWRRRGSEDAFSESIGTFSHEVLNDLMKVPEWQMYLEHRGLAWAL